MKIMNISILAHVDAGKTSLTEALLEASLHKDGGSVDSGTSTTDTDQLEIERGISIYTATTSLTYNNTKINIIDTPGHMDFIHEVEQALIVTDLAILVIAANDHTIQPQTYKAYQKLRDLKIPTIIFVNKVDIKDADVENLIMKINKMTEHLSEDLENINSCCEKIAYISDDFFNEYLNGRLNYKKYMIQAIKERKFIPILKGSAIKKLGIIDLLELLSQCSKDKDMRSELSALIYKKDFSKNRKVQTYMRLYSGEISVQDKITVDGQFLKVTKLMSPRDGEIVNVDSVGVNDIAIVEGFDACPIASWIGVKSDVPLPSWTIGQYTCALFYEGGARVKVLDALNKLTSINPFLSYDINEITQEISLNLVGAIQKEVIETSLIRDFNLKVTLGDVTINNKLRPNTEVIDDVIMNTIENSHWASMKFKLEPREINSGFKYETLVNTGYLKQAFQNAIVESLYLMLKTPYQGMLLTDFKITLLDAEFASPVSTPSDFRHSTQILFNKILSQCDFDVLEPLGSFELRIPEDSLKKAYYDLSLKEATITDTDYEDNLVLIKGFILLKHALNYHQSVLSYTFGLGSFNIEPHSYVRQTND